MQAAAPRPRARRDRCGDRAAPCSPRPRSRRTSRSERRDESLARSVRLLTLAARLRCPALLGALDLRLDARLGAPPAPVSRSATSSPGRRGPSPATGPRRSTPRSTPPRRCSTRSGWSRSARCSSPPRSSLLGTLTPPPPDARRSTAGSCASGRDDLANPYRVQETFEGIAGAIGVRWYERLWRGRDHFAVEIHWLPDALDPLHDRRAPLPRTPRSSGPLEDLYPDVELVGSRRRSPPGRSVVRLKKRRLVRAVDPDHAQLRARVRRVARRAAVGTRARDDRPARPHAGARIRRTGARGGCSRRRERGLQHADHRDPGELGIDSVVEAKELKGALELQHRSLLLLRPARHRRRPRPRCSASPASSRSCAPRTSSCAATCGCAGALYARTRSRSALPNPLPGWRTGVLSTSELATLWQLPRARVKHGALPRSTVRRAIAPPEIERDAEPRADARRARPGLDRARATASTATRSSAARAAARAR